MDRTKRKFSVLVNLILVSTLILFCERERPEPILARAGKTTIPVAEFKERFEFTPHVSLTKNQQKNKRLVLSSLLGEKLLVEEAYSRKLDKNPQYQFYVQQMEKEAIVEKLFDEEISSKIKIDDAEIKQGFFRSLSNLKLEVLTFDNLQQAQEAEKMIAAGKTLTQVKQALQTDTFISADSVLTINLKWGEAHPELENVAYSLALNQVSAPVFAAGKYFILKLVDRTREVLATESDYLNQAPSIRKKIIDRRRTEYFDQYMRELMAEKSVRVPHEIFDLVADFLEKHYGISDSLSTVEPLPRDLAPMLEESSDFKKHLQEPFARFNDGSSWTVEDFLKKLIYGPFRLNTKSKENFRKSLRIVVRRMAEFETLAKKGAAQGLDKTYYVKYQTKMWADSFLGQAVRQMIIDTVTVSESELKQYYEKNKTKYPTPAMVNLHEILVNDKKLAEQILQRIKNGEDMAQLARKYNQRAISQKTDGVMGYFSVSALGSIGEAARVLEIGALGGPVKTEKGQYSVFKVLDKTESGPLPFEQNYPEIHREALAEKRIKAVDDYLIKLMDKHDLEINNSVLDTLTTNEINMLVMKKHYANRPAAPFVTPVNPTSRWHEKVEKFYSAKGEK